MLPTVFRQSPPSHQGYDITTRLQCDVMSFSEELASVKPEKEMVVFTVPTLCMSQMEPQAADTNQPMLAIALPEDAVAEC